MSQLSVEQKAASLLMLHAPGTDPAPLRALVDAGVSGLILMGDNMPATPPELAALTDAVQADADAPVLLGIDEEGGEVQRLPWDGTAGAEQLRAAPPPAAEEAFGSRAAALSDVGVDVNFGIVADVTADADSFIAGRVLGGDPQSAADRVAAAVAGERGAVLSTLKHFPGHGAAPGDSHASVPTAPLSIDEWRAGPAIPFEAGIDAGAELVMTGHLAYPAVDAAPASLSPEWHRILREELGFDGVVVTDDMLMLQHNGAPEYADPGENAVRAVEAGSDLLLYVLPPIRPSSASRSTASWGRWWPRWSRGASPSSDSTTPSSGCSRSAAGSFRNRMSAPGIDPGLMRLHTCGRPTGRSDITLEKPQDDEHCHDDRDPRLPRRHVEGRHRPQRGRLQHPPHDDQQGEGQVRAIRRDLRDRREPPRLDA